MSWLPPTACKPEWQKKHGWLIFSALHGHQSVKTMATSRDAISTRVLPGRKWELCVLHLWVSSAFSEAASVFLRTSPVGCRRTSRWVTRELPAEARIKPRRQLENYVDTWWVWLVVWSHRTTKATICGMQVWFHLPTLHSFHAAIITRFYHFSSNCRAHHSSHGEQVGMVAALLQVHHNVEQGHLVPSTFGVQSLKVSRQNELVIFPAGQKKKQEEERRWKRKTTISYRHSSKATFGKHTLWNLILWLKALNN